ncbi:phospholipase D/nuclease [Cadophora sp. DSE1049]|nr:phospholipase D/nuclease [Cadophora sp. DSE1049]
MDDDLERALPASRAEASQHEEDRELQEAIRLSKMDGSSTQSGSPTPSPEPADEDRDLKEAIRLSMMDDASTASGTPSPSPEPEKSKAGSKRKAEEDLGPQSMKRAQAARVDLTSSNYSPGYQPPGSPERVTSSLSAISKAEAKMTYAHGALRITRTPGRVNSKNCINLRDVIQGKSLVSACAFSFFIGEEEFYRHFPLTHSSDKVPIYIGRDVNMDPMTPDACEQAGVPLIIEDGKAPKVAKKTMPLIEPKLQDLYAKRYGVNYHAFYAWCSGSSHSKILVLVYPDFLRVVITSCNMMDIDTVLGDNHWYIHDLPKRASRSKTASSSFEADLLSHLSALSVPEAFIQSIQGIYDYSKVKVHLTTSVPGVCSGAKAEKHGLLRLRRIVNGLNLELPRMGNGRMRLDLCAASIGRLTATWLNSFNDCALGKGRITTGDENQAVPDIKLFYPTVGDVKSADPLSQDAASNIGCHIHPWAEAPNAIKRIFHHYQSKDTGKLFHQKLILAYDPRDTTAPPYYVYIGSANLSQSAWGALEVDKKKNKATCDTKLVKLSNFECGVVVPGNLVKDLLEEGTTSWQSGIVPFEQTAAPYNLTKDKPWNDPRWVVNFD